MAASHEVHYFVVSGTGGGGAGGFAGRGGTSSDASQVTLWIEAHFGAKTVGAKIRLLAAPCGMTAGFAPQTWLCRAVRVLVW
jgi:hypothetical protein